MWMDYHKNHVSCLWQEPVVLPLANRPARISDQVNVKCAVCQLSLPVLRVINPVADFSCTDARTIASAGKIAKEIETTAVTVAPE